MAKGKYEKWQTPEGILKLEGWARDGLTDEQIAHNIGIRRPTLYEWKKKYPDISDALKRGKEVVDREVENSLLRRATGTKTRTVTYKMVKVDEEVLKVRRVRFLNGYKLDHPELSKSELTLIAIENVPTYERIPMIEVENELAPDTSAAIFWLKNRKPELFRDQSFKGLNDAQAAKARADVRKANAEAEIAEIKVASLKETDSSTENRIAILMDKINDELVNGDDSNRTEPDLHNQTDPSDARRPD